MRQKLVIPLVICSVLGIAAIGRLVHMRSQHAARDAGPPVAPRPLRAAQVLASVCDDGTTDQDEARCFTTRAALGRYQEIIDAIEARSLGLENYQEYFAGIAYFALANRTGADSLRCFRLGRARTHLENYLSERRTNYQGKLNFGTAEEMKYTYIAGRTLESVNAAEGCDEPAESLVSLARYGRKYLTDTTEQLFFDFGASGGDANAISNAFNTELKVLQDTVRGFVGVASRLESDFSLSQVEIQSGWRVLSAAVKAINDWARAGDDTLAPAIVETRDASSGAPNYTFAPALDALKLAIDQEYQRYAELSDGRGRLGAAKATVDRRITAAGANGMQDYAAKRAEVLKVGVSLVAKITSLAQAEQQLLTAQSLSDLKQAPNETASRVLTTWSEIERAWRHERPGCDVNPNKWYC